MNILQTIGALTLLLITAGVLVAATGLYPVAADRPHWQITEWLIAKIRDHAIEQNLTGITIPGDLDNPERFLAGAGNYDSMCSSCHLKPGTTNSELYMGLYPQPPKLAETGRGDNKRQFWIIKHGLKMTGMPAWGTSHGDEDIWSMVAFLQKLPDMDAQAYRDLIAQSGGHQHAGGHDGDDHHTDTPAQAADTQPRTGGPVMTAKSQGGDPSPPSSSPPSNPDRNAPDHDDHGHAPHSH